MPKLKNRLPSYCRHKASGHAVVTPEGRDHCLGPYSTKASKAAYEALIARWLSGELASPTRDFTIGELVAKYWRFVRGHYVKNGLPTFEQNCIRCALRPLLKLYGDDSVDSFGPKALKAVRDEFIRNGQCRQTVNANVGRVRRLFKWAESEELVAAGTHHTLCTVAGSQRGRTTAREADPVEPVSDSMIDAVLPHLTATVADMVRFQRFTGCRPNEVCQLRPCDVDRSGDVWRYIPATHKTEHRNRQRIILIGPKAQAILLRYLARDSEAYCFSPVDSEATRRATRQSKNAAVVWEQARLESTKTCRLRALA